MTDFSYPSDVPELRSGKRHPMKKSGRAKTTVPNPRIWYNHEGCVFVDKYQRIKLLCEAIANKRNVSLEASQFR